jgi:hypothetical protein
MEVKERYPMAKQREVVVVEAIEPRILMLRSQKVMLDADLAELYGTTTKALNQAVKRNYARFPTDFVFTLTPEEKQEVVTNCDHLAKLKFSRTLPYAFTEHGVIMAATILNTDQAIEVSVYVVRAFVKLREVIATHKELAHTLAELERKVGSHDESIRALVAAFQQLMTPPPEPKRGRIGFRAATEE